ncbi:hypothetical protein D1872_288400 [compost metagenome]
MNHTYPQLDRLIGVINLNRFPTDLNRTFIRLIQAKQNIHQSRFTGTILAEQSMNLPFTQRQTNRIICHNAGKTFCDLLQLDNGCRSAHEITLITFWIT